VLLAWLAILALSLVLARRLRHDATVQARLHAANLSVIDSESRLRATLESSLDGVLAINDSGCIIAFNPAAEKIFDRTSAEVMGRPMEDFLVPSHLRHDHQAGLKQYVKGNEGPVLQRLNRRMETVGMRRDGTIFPLELTVVSSMVNGAVFFTATVRDITELRATENALHEARLRELEIGSRIQQSLLAANPARQLSGLWLTSYNQASKGVDGDFFDVIQMGDHCVDILAGDVMGKGVPAALMGAATKLQFSRSIAELLTLRGHGGEPPHPAAIVASVHEAMTPHLQDLEAFVTLVYVRIDSLRNVITWIGCGHEETIVVRGHGGIEFLPNQHPPLGILSRQYYTEDEAPLAIGDAVFLCSDGLTDAIGVDGVRLGRDLVSEAVNLVVRAHPAPAAALHALRRQVLQEGVQVVDDITMVLIVRTALHDYPTRYELPIALDAIRGFRQFVAAHAQRVGLSEDDAGIFVVAGVEVFTNIIRHAQGLLPGAPVELIIHDTPGALTLDIVYLGAQFTPPDEVVDTDFSAFPEGGFGLTIIRSSCDRVDYLHHQGVNTVRMVRGVDAN
jgi:PAS domain S-box-containing protein